jgi:hypothetical protein
VPHTHRHKKKQRSKPKKNTLHCWTALATKRNQHTKVSMLDSYWKQKDRNISLRLFPRDDNTRRLMESVKLIPHLQLNCNRSKTVSSIVNHLTVKWINAIPERHCVRLFPKRFNFSMVAHKGWGVEDTKSTIQQIYSDQAATDVSILFFGAVHTEI